jgi:hypothetical protein
MNQSDTYLAGVIHGDGSGLTNLNLAANGITNGLQSIPVTATNIFALATNTVLIGGVHYGDANKTNGTFSSAGGEVFSNGVGTVTIKGGSVTASGTFTGNGSGLTNLNAASLTGTVSLAQLPNYITNNVHLMGAGGGQAITIPHVNSGFQFFPWGFGSTAVNTNVGSAPITPGTYTAVYVIATANTTVPVTTNIVSHFQINGTTAFSVTNVAPFLAGVPSLASNVNMQIVVPENSYGEVQWTNTGTAVTLPNIQLFWRIEGN